MIVAVLMGYFNFLPDKEIKSSILVAGLFLAIVFSALVHLWMLVLLYVPTNVEDFPAIMAFPI